ncbi:2-oxopent-4-enoate hydratase [Pseudocolwellia sp. HL-MZ19]|uniref:2-oxopent-4-enoate hydratase n=1 Tax=Pseudocolwellia sp. HL-MZ19 TaxID=3400846 RepID=UPI003CFA201F
MNKSVIEQCGDQLYKALRTGKQIKPLTEEYPDISIDDAYQISLHLNKLRLADGEKIIGKKIGVTSKAVMNMLKVDQPDFGFLTDKMVFSQGEDVIISDQLIQPKAEGEIAFILKSDLVGPGITAADVLAATDFVMPAIEVVDSRIKDWKIKIQDTVADNASCGVFILGDTAVDPRDIDLTTCGMVVEKNGSIISTGAGAAALNSPVNCVAWLANTLGSYGIALKAGEVIMSGSLVPLEPVVAGDSMVVSVGGMGSVSARFV